MDFTARIDQTACDKLISSVTYPFVGYEERKPFPGCENLSLVPAKDYYRLSDDEVDELFIKALDGVKRRPAGQDNTIDDAVYSFGGSIVQQSKVVLDAASNPDYEGPDREVLSDIVENGIEGLGKTLKGFLGDWGIYAWCPHIRITIKTKPSIKLKSPLVELNGINVEVLATGELYAKYPWFNCYRWCTKWEKVIKCDKIASITVAPDIAIEAHADFIVSGQRVLARALFDKLRLDYDILRLLPLEDWVNPSLRNKILPVYDAAKLIATIPVLESSFRVQSIALPAQADGIQVDVDVVEV